MDSRAPTVLRIYVSYIQGQLHGATRGCTPGMVKTILGWDLTLDISAIVRLCIQKQHSSKVHNDDDIRGPPEW
jgi:hypothetical protein